MKYEVWMEGYRCMEGSSKAKYLGKYDTNTFKEACDLSMKEHGYEDWYDEEKLTMWGCKLFDNESDARKNFG